MDGLYAGSFDPVTLGHWNIINRAAKLVDRLYVLVSENPSKKYMFNSTQRANLIFNDLPKKSNIIVMRSDQLVVDIAMKNDVKVIFRGLRPHGDFEPEYGMATINADLAPGIETVFLIADPKSAAISSSAVKQLAHFKRDISAYVTPAVALAISQR